MSCLTTNRCIGSPWDQDKAMLDTWGLSSMKPFDQVGVKHKEIFPVEESSTESKGATVGVTL